MTRAALLPFAWVAVLWFFLRCRSLPRGWFYAFLAFLGLIAGLAPAVVLNIRAAHESLPIVDSTYYHLWQGNNPQATGGPMPADLPGQTNKELARTVRNEIRSQPAATLQHRLRAGLDFFFGEAWFTEQKLSREEPAMTASPPMPPWLRDSYPAILCGTLLGMLLLAALGWPGRFPGGTGPGRWRWLPSGFPFLTCSATPRPSKARACRSTGFCSALPGLPCASLAGLREMRGSGQRRGQALNGPMKSVVVAQGQPGAPSRFRNASAQAGPAEPRISILHPPSSILHPLPPLLLDGCPRRRDHEMALSPAMARFES